MRRDALRVRRPLKLERPRFRKRDLLMHPDLGLVGLRMALHDAALEHPLLFWPDWLLPEL